MMDEENMELDPEEEMDEIIELVDEEGNTETFELLASFVMDDVNYLALTPEAMDESDEEVEVVIMRTETDGEGNDTYIPVTDEQEADAAFARFMELIETEEE